jgi:hypothetical protein
MPRATCLERNRICAAEIVLLQTSQSQSQDFSNFDPLRRTCQQTYHKYFTARNVPSDGTIQQDYTSTTSVVPLSHSGRHRFTTLVKKSRVLFRVSVWTRSPHAEKRTFQYNRQHRVKICVISIANNCCFGVVPNVVIIGKRGANFISCFLIIHPL